MFRIFLLISVTCLICGCERRQSAADQLKVELKETRAAVAASQQRLITTSAQSVNAISLIPKGSNWDYRFQAQDHFVNLEGKNILAEVKVNDIVRHTNGLIVSGEPAAFTYPLLIWLRLHGVRDDVADQIDSHDRVICIGQPTVTAPDGPYLEMQAVNEDEIEVETSAIPLIIDISCTHAWKKI